MMYAIELKEIEPRIVASIRTTSPWERFGKALGEVLEEVGKYLRKIGVEPVGPPFARYFSLNDNVVEFEAGLPIATLIDDSERVAVGTLPGGKVAMTWHTGPYEGLTDAHAAIKQWIGEQGLKGEEAFWEIYWSDPRKGADPATWKSEVIWPVR